MGVSYLLDTHVFLWLLTNDEHVPAAERDLLADNGNELFVSAASAFEVSTKVRLGKLHAPGLVESWAQRIAAIRAQELPISGPQAISAGSLPWSHRDPFDRLLVAQAIAERLTLVTVDRAIRDFEGVELLTW